MIHICIPVHNRVDYTIRCIESILNQTYKEFKIVICNDGSEDRTESLISSKFPSVDILQGDGNLWWTGAINFCISHALKFAKEGDFIYTLNNDTELFPNTLELLYKESIQRKRAIMGTCNVFFNNASLIEPSAFVLKKNRLVRLNNWGDDIKKSKDQCISVSALAGKGVLIPIEVFRSIGMYNADLLPHYHADTEFTFRAFRSGYSLYINYKCFLKSHQNLSGLGSRTSEPVIKEFIKSFYSIKSPHHLKSLKAWNKLVYPRLSWFFYYMSIIGIILGFVKRWLRKSEVL